MTLVAPSLQQFIMIIKAGTRQVTPCIKFEVS